MFITPSKRHNSMGITMQLSSSTLPLSFVGIGEIPLGLASHKGGPWNVYVVTGGAVQ